MKVQLIRTRDGFLPSSAHDEQSLESVKPGDVIYGDFRQPRNPGHHRKAFALLHRIYDNLPDEMSMTFRQFYNYMKVAAGAVEQTISQNGEVFYVVKSLSFAELDQAEFDQVYRQFITVAYERLGMEWVLEYE